MGSPTKSVVDSNCHTIFIDKSQKRSNLNPKNIWQYIVLSNLSLKWKMTASVCHQMLSVHINHRRIVDTPKPEPTKIGILNEISEIKDIELELIGTCDKNLSIILLSCQLLST